MADVVDDWLMLWELAATGEGVTKSGVHLVLVAEPGAEYTQRASAHNGIAGVPSRGSCADEKEHPNTLGCNPTQAYAQPRPTHGRRGQPMYVCEEQVDALAAWIVHGNSAQVQLCVADRLRPDLPVEVMPEAEQAHTVSMQGSALAELRR